MLTRWSTKRDETVEELAARLWLHPEALRQAQAMIDARQARVGRLTKHILHARPRVRIDITAPPKIVEVVHQYCQGRQLTSSTLIRSLVHKMLLEPRNPPLTDQWIWEGKVFHVLGVKTRKSGLIRPLKTDITPGASRALASRAIEANTTPTALVRGLLMEVLTNRVNRYEILTRVNQMWDDENRYIMQIQR